jgi:branched-chain amino acid transport system permease protein
LPRSDLTRRAPALALAGVAVVLLATAPLWAGPYALSLLTRSVVLGIAAIGLFLIVRVGGMVSLGHAATIGIGAYTAALLASAGIFNGWLIVAAGGLASAIWGCLAGLVFARLRGLRFMLASLAAAQIVYFAAVGAYPLGGDDGFSMPGDARFLPAAMATAPAALYLACLGVLLLSLAVFAGLERAPIGLTLAGLRGSEARMVSLGYAATPARLIVLGAGSAAGGVAGALLADYSDFVSPSMMDWTRSGELLAIVLVGRAFGWVGPLAGAFLFVFAESELPRITEHWRLPFGLFLTALALISLRK